MKTKSTVGESFIVDYEAYIRIAKREKKEPKCLFQTTTAFESTEFEPLRFDFISVL